MKELLIKEPTDKDIIKAFSIYYKGRNIVKDFSTILKQVVLDEFYNQIKTNDIGDAIIITSDKIGCTESFVSSVVYYSKK